MDTSSLSSLKPGFTQRILAGGYESTGHLRLIVLPL
jgi:hypothetical protein